MARNDFINDLGLLQKHVLKRKAWVCFKRGLLQECFGLPQKDLALPKNDMALSQ